MRLIWVLVSALTFLGANGCSTSATGADSKVAYSTSHPSFSDYSEALRYVYQEMQKGRNTIGFRYEGSDSHKVAERLSHDSLHQSLVTKVRCMAMGQLVMLVPEYVDDCLLLAAHRGDLPLSALSDAQQKALSKIQGVVHLVKKHHHHPYDQALALHDYVLQTSHYDETTTRWNHATVTVDLINTHRAVCDGYTRLYHLLLSLAGIENRIVIGKSDKNIAHSWNLVCIDGQWMHVDCTYDDPVPDEEQRVMRHYFGMSDRLIAVNHSWTRADYPAAVSDSLYYPTTRGLCFDTLKEFLQYCAEHAADGQQTISAYVQELVSCRAGMVKTRLEQAQASMQLNVLKRIQVDDATPGIIYGYFR